MEEKKKYQLNIRDLRNWNKWHSSEEFDSFDELIKEYGPWLASHPGRIVTFTFRYAVTATERK